MLGISKATLHRRKAAGRLDQAESDRVVRFARLMGGPSKSWSPRKTPANGSPRRNSAWVARFLSNTPKPRSARGKSRTCWAALNTEFIPNGQSLAHRKEKHAATAFTGEGAAKTGGRSELTRRSGGLHQRHQIAAPLENLVHMSARGGVGLVFVSEANSAGRAGRRQFKRT